MKCVLAIMAASLLILTSLGCEHGKAQPSGAAQQFARPIQSATPLPVSSLLPPEGTVVTGPVTVEEQLDVVSQRSGIIVSLPVDVDTNLQKDQLLARLDDRQLVSDRRAAEYKMESLESDLKNWEAELQVRQADLRRAEEMRKAGINTQEEYDHSRYNVTATEFEVERQRDEMLEAKATLSSIDLELEKTKILAPFKGTVSQRYVRLGQYVAVGDKLFRVMGTSPPEVRFTLPGTEVTELKRGDLVTVSPTPEFQRTTTATVTHISPVVDPGSGTIEVTAVLKERLPGLIPGTIASIRIASAR
jgi:membrane fusion protein, multidrug efflux system